MEQNTHIIEFQDIGFATKFGGVVDTHSILDKRFITAQIVWLTGIDRYLEEGAASAAQRFQGYREYCTPNALEMISQFLRDDCTHLRILPAFQNGLSEDYKALLYQAYPRVHILSVV